MEEGARQPRTSHVWYPEVVSRNTSKRFNRPISASEHGHLGFFMGLLERHHVFSRMARFGQHLPILYLAGASFAGVVFFPLIIILCSIAGSVGLVLLIIIFLESGFFVMAVIAFMLSLLLPILVGLPFAVLSYIVYHTSHWLKSFMWEYFGGPIRRYYSVKQRFQNAIASFRGDPAIEYPRTSPNHTTNIDNWHSIGYEEEEVVIHHYERSQSSPSLTDELQDIRRRLSDGVALHEDYSDHMGVAEGACLYMADFMNNLLTLVFFVWIVVMLVQAFSQPPEPHNY